MSMQDYNSRLSDPDSRKFETFSYLPAMTKEEIRKQVEYLVKCGLNPAIEHTDVDRVLAECEACRAANPDNHIRLIGYNNFTQSQGASMVIFRGKTV
jgi:ribulose-bisphosphate carboxylase small chain